MNATTVSLAGPSVSSNADGGAPVSQIDVYWSDLRNEAGCTLQYDTTGSFTSPTVLTYGTSATSAGIGGLATGVTYYFRIRGTIAPTYTGAWSSTTSVATYVPAPVGVDTNLAPGNAATYMYWWGSCPYGTIYWWWSLSASGTVGSNGSGG